MNKEWTKCAKAENEEDKSHFFAIFQISKKNSLYL